MLQKMRVWKLLVIPLNRNITLRQTMCFPCGLCVWSYHNTVVFRGTVCRCVMFSYTVVIQAWINTIELSHEYSILHVF